MEPRPGQLLLVDHLHRLGGAQVARSRYGLSLHLDVAQPGGLTRKNSGKSLHRRALAADMRDAAILEPLDDRATGAVAVWDVLLYMVEVAEFAARVATELRCDHLSFDICLAGIAGRQLIAGSTDDYVPDGLIVYADQLTASRQIDSTALLSD